MARAGLILAATHDLIESNIRPGVSTAELDKLAERFIRSQGATPTFKGYRGFPGSICASPNAMIVHGIPGSYRLKAGDIISIDVGVTLDGWVADAARTFAVEEVGQEVRKLLDVTERRCTRASRSAGTGNRMGDVSSAIQRMVEGAGFSVVRSLVGHGVGRSMHEDPQVPNYGKPGKGTLLEEGMVLAIEPMTTAGRARRARGRRRLGDLLPGRLRGGALRVHRRDHRRRTADPDPVASAAGRARARGRRHRRGRGARGRAARRGDRERGLRLLPSGVLPKRDARCVREGMSSTR